MSKRTDIHKILVIGSGPIIIGQAAEFDYAGTQACLALKEEGYEVVLCNSNPATIMTDDSVADKIYMEPLTEEFLAKIIRIERPDAILAGIGGQTGLNLAIELEKNGVLEQCRTMLLGTDSECIEKAEDREKFKELCLNIGEPVLPSDIASSPQEAFDAAEKIGYPVVVRPAFTLGGTGGGFADSREDLEALIENALEQSPAKQVLIEKSVKGFKEIEYEVMRDKNDTAIVICNMENIDPVGIHTGDSIVVCPSQTLTNKEYQMLRNSALKVIRALGIEGGCNVQFALDPNSFEYYLIEVNPRVSRSSALASKASGYPIARVSAKISIGMSLDEIAIANTPAAFEPSLDYVVCKLPRFPFDKFTDADNKLGTQMKATGEVMSIGRTFEESLLKGIRSLETGARYLKLAKFTGWDTESLLKYIVNGSDDRIYAVAEALRKDVSCDEISKCSGIDMFFISKIKKIIEIERRLAESSASDPGSLEMLSLAKKAGFPDRAIADIWGIDEMQVFTMRKNAGIMPVYKMIDTCASEFESYIPYFYSTYSGIENESLISDRKKIIVLGSGPIRIGQGVEFDYSTVHAVKTIRNAGYEAIIINNNPETVSTDYTTSDKLYFEPLTTEDVMNIVTLENADGMVATLGGQTAVNLAESLTLHGVKLIGTDYSAIRRAEDRDEFEHLMESLNIPQPKGCAVTNIEDGVRNAAEIGYPVLVRPSFVLGGRAMQIVSKEKDLRHYLQTAVEIDADKPVLVDKYIRGKEIEVDAVCDGTDAFTPGIMELVERTGVHSGDSISVFPSVNISDKVKRTVFDYVKKLGLGIGIIGLYNIQFIVDKDENVYIIEVNPRSSRTVPFLSKASKYGMADIATKVMLGISLREQGLPCIDSGEDPVIPDRYYVKVPAFSFSKLKGMDSYLSPEMKSTGEALGYDKHLHRAMYKAMLASGMKLASYGTVVVSLADEDKEECVPLIERFYRLGFNIEATSLTGQVLRSYGIRTKILGKPSEGSNEVVEEIRDHHPAYVINTRAILSGIHYQDGVAIRNAATQNRVTMLTSLDTVRVLLDVLEEQNIGVGTVFG